MPVAYRVPLPQNYRDEFDALDLQGTVQTLVTCPCQCGVEYSLITPEDEAPEMIAMYRDHIIAHAGPCNQHPGKIVLNF